MTEHAWIGSNVHPIEAGYYLTVYLNPNGNTLVKAFWFDTGNGEWSFRFKPDVRAWWNSRYDHYVPCQMQSNVDPIPKEYR